jgi:hypothetical protein
MQKEQVFEEGEMRKALHAKLDICLLRETVFRAPDTCSQFRINSGGKFGEASWQGRYRAHAAIPFLPGLASVSEQRRSRRQFLQIDRCAMRALFFRPFECSPSGFIREIRLGNNVKVVGNPRS